MANGRDEAERRRRQTLQDLTLLSSAFLPRAAGLSGGGTQLYAQPGRSGETAARPAVASPYGGDAGWTIRNPQAREPDTERSRALEKSLASTTRAVLDLAGGLSGNTRAVRENTSGLVSAVKALAGGLGGGGFSGLGGFSGILKAATGLLPVAGFVAGLFKRNKKPDPATFTERVEPSPIQLSVTNTDNILRGFPRTVRGYADQVRSTAANPLAATAPQQERQAAASATTAPLAAQQAQPQVTVNISAMDSRSFLDRSADIAKAMREAMLHSHPVNDVIGEL